MKLQNSELDKVIESNISQLEKNLVKFSKISLELNFYQKKVSSFYFMQQLTNLWESWKFILVIKNESESNFTDLNTKQKENKIRDYIFYILEKLNDKFDFMPDINLDDPDLPKETFPYEVSLI
jgi:hypothetical protein